MAADADGLVSHLRIALGNQCLPGRKVCVALSGGMDSVVLLHALVQLRAQIPITLLAIHVNHGLSPHAAAWSDFCRQTCQTLEVVCEVATLAPLKTAGGGLERAAREARYAKFACVDADVLCMAHHQNDRAETLLLNLFRGAGPQGLAAMPSSRWLNDKQLIRPFIDLPRSELLAWAKAQNLCWIEDESNENLHFRRNYLRHVVLPAVAKQFPGVTAVLARTAEQMQEQTALLNRLAEADARACLDENGCLKVSLMALLPEPAMRNVLKHQLNQAGVHIPAARRLQALATQLVDVRPDAAVFVRLGEMGCHVWRDNLWLDPAMNLSLPRLTKVLDGITDWPDGRLVIKGGAEAGKGSNVLVQAIGHGQRFQPAGRCRGVVSEMLREQGIPPWVRLRLPALWIDCRLCWVAGLGWANEGADCNQALSLTWSPIAQQRL